MPILQILHHPGLGRVGIAHRTRPPTLRMVGDAHPTTSTDARLCMWPNTITIDVLPNHNASRHHTLSPDRNVINPRAVAK